MERLRRKIDAILAEWSANKERMPLIIKGARQIGKTEVRLHVSAEIFFITAYPPSCFVDFIIQKEDSEGKYLFRGLL